MIFCLTSIEQDALRLVPSVVVAVIVAVPGDLAVTMPSLLTVATDVLLDRQVTVLLVALVGSTVAISCRTPPSVISALVMLSAIDEAFTCTVTVHEALRLLPSVVRAVTVTEPVPTAPILRRELFTTCVTITLLLGIIHSNVWLSALEGDTVAVRVYMPSGSSVNWVSLNVRLCTSKGVTVT